jgi:hypothetical protein
LAGYSEALSLSREKLRLELEESREELRALKQKVSGYPTEAVQEMLEDSATSATAGKVRKIHVLWCVL